MERGAHMVGIVRAIQVDGKTWVALEDYQELLRKYEALVPPCSNEEIVAAAGEDEVYDE